MSSASFARKGKPEKLSSPALANRRFAYMNQCQLQGSVPEEIRARVVAMNG
jgi:hypothetical protein